MFRSKMWGTLSEPRARSMIGIVLLFVLFFFYLVFVFANLTTSFDDAYMFLRYADNVLNGHGIAWNPDGVQTYGATSLLYLLLIVLGRGLFSQADGSAVLVITSSVLGLASLIVMAVIGNRSAASEYFKSHRLALPLLLAFFFFLSPTFLFHATSGMDTTLAMLCNTLLIFAAMNWTAKQTAGSTAWLVLAAYASFLARPDNLIYAVLFPVIYGYFFHREQRMRMLVQFLAALIGVIALDTLVKYFIFGDPLPLPFYAKTVGYDDGYAGAFRWNPVAYLYDLFRALLPFLLFFIFSISKQTRMLAAAFFVPAAFTFAYYFSVTQIMGFGARYYFPSMPFFVIGGFLMLDLMLQQTSSVELFKQPMRVTTSIVVLLFLFLPPVRTFLENAYEQYFIPTAIVYESDLVKEVETALPELGWWESINIMADISSQLPAGTRISMSEYGLVGASAPQIMVIDPLGLHDPYFAHNGFSSAEFFSRKPDLIWFPNPDYTKIVASIQDDSTLWQEYDYYPGAFDYGIAIRKDADDTIRQIIEKSWSEKYPDVAMSPLLVDQP